MDLWLDGSRACQLCGATVVDARRDIHEAFHVRVDPVVVQEPATDIIVDEVVVVDDVNPHKPVINPADEDAEPRKPVREK